MLNSIKNDGGGWCLPSAILFGWGKVVFLQQN
jgi:hypothetical protein